MKTIILKKSKNIILATLLIAGVLGTVAIAQNPSNTNLSTCEITGSDVVTYLEGYGYSNVVATAINGSTRATACDWIADTDYSYDTYVDCSETAIISHEDLQ